MRPSTCDSEFRRSAQNFRRWPSDLVTRFVWTLPRCCGLWRCSRGRPCPSCHQCRGGTSNPVLASLRQDRTSRMRVPAFAPRPRVLLTLLQTRQVTPLPCEHSWGATEEGPCAPVRPPCGSSSFRDPDASSTRCRGAPSAGVGRPKCSSAAVAPSLWAPGRPCGSL